MLELRHASLHVLYMYIIIFIVIIIIISPLDAKLSIAHQQPTCISTPTGPLQALRLALRRQEV